MLDRESISLGRRAASQRNAYKRADTVGVAGNRDGAVAGCIASGYNPDIVPTVQTSHSERPPFSHFDRVGGLLLEFREGLAFCPTQ